nr:immunoglobulin light chain junction region [Macaca mulatta]
DYYCQSTDSSGNLPLI